MRGSLVLILMLVVAASVPAQSGPEYAVKANDAAGKGKHEEAIALYTKAIELMPTDDSLYSGRSFEYEAMGKLDLAIADMTKAVGLPSSFLDSRLLRRGDLYVHQGKYDAALADFDTVLKNWPKKKQAYWNRAVAYLMMGKPELAAADAMKYLAGEDLSDLEAEDFPSKIIFVGYLSLRKAGRSAEAKAFIDKYVPQFPSGMLEGRVAAFLQGAETAERLMSAFPSGDQGYAHLYIGESLLLAGNKTGAVTHFKAARDGTERYSFEYDLAVVELARLAGPR